MRIAAHLKRWAFLFLGLDIIKKYGKIDAENKKRYI